MSSRAIPMVLAASMVGALALPLTASGTSSPASAILTAALRDAKASRWVHETVRVLRGSVVVETSRNDIGTREGLQIVTSIGGGSSRLLAFDKSKSLFVRANANALSGIYLMTSANATTYAGQWLELTPVDSIYESTSFATSLASDFSQVRFTGPVTVGDAIFEARHVRSLSGVVPAMNGAPSFKGTLYVTTSGTIRPVGFREVDAKATIIVAWSNWGHAYDLVAPTGAVPYPTSGASTAG
jgi:hypothetical protein